MDMYSFASSCHDLTPSCGLPHTCRVLSDSLAYVEFDGCLLGCSAVHTGRSLLRFQRSLLPPSSGRLRDDGDIFVCWVAYQMNEDSCNSTYSESGAKISY
jgi:hypothetical protein